VNDARRDNTRGAGAESSRTDVDATQPPVGDTRAPQAPIKGRGAASWVHGRFEKTRAHGEDDGWGSAYEHALDDGVETIAPDPRTRVTEERARSVISRNQSPDVGFDRSINPYRGCEHGCVYCFARPSHAYLDLSPGLDFETRLFAKTNAAQRLRAELAKPGYVPAPIALGINTDAYQPIERRYRITREVLEVLAECRHPVSFVTKSALITRDLDLLAPMAREGLVSVHFSITTLDNRLAAAMEPRATAPHGKLRAMRTLADAGVPVGVMVAPVIPMISDHELEHILEAARAHGACNAGYVLLRLPHELKQVWREWLQLHYPDRAAHVMSLIRQMRGGQDYDSAFGTRMRGEGPFAQLLAARFAKARARLGFGRMPALVASNFVAPLPPSPQGDLFGPVKR
jgi:DNA repair photolyase